LTVTVAVTVAATRMHELWLFQCTLEHIVQTGPAEGTHLYSKLDWINTNKKGLSKTGLEMVQGWHIC